MEYTVEREPGQYHIQERGYTTRGTTVTDEWLKEYGFGTLTRTNIDAVVQAAAASAVGVILDPYAASRMPKDIEFTASSQSFRPQRSMDIPDRILRK